ncbi:amidohydrolase [Fontibacillus panacisegetis]|uniref:Amidohydrolase n=1 Tax=Fontibacillus panacisegetis TaxID=670482 RepID=A0A1G7I3B4_9BACL|nr:M20 family metallopeptidase [Fontibacillus panacisegetis]SDF07083.1 amidohydrolase [Fontibacillus panacisegetis]
MELELLKTLFPNMVECRRYLHRHPELSFKEQETSKMIASKLEQLGVQSLTGIGGYGVIGRIRGALPGKTVALRADMDALPIQDEKNVDYASQVPGVMHACGHDGHTAILLAVAEYYSHRREQLRGEIVFIFQPAEEVFPGGAMSMIKSGALQDVDVIYGIHLWTPIPVGTSACSPGPMMASTDEFIIDIQGRGGHGGMPHTAVDSVVAASSLVMQLQSIVSRSVDPLDPAVVTIGSIQGGTAQNVIADRCRIAGTVRCFNEETRSFIRDRIYALAEGTAAAYGAEAIINYTMSYPCLVNDNEEFHRFYNVGANKAGLVPEVTPKIMPAEDFAYYLQHVPGCFMLVGAGNESKGILHPHHHPKFDIDEEAMLYGACLLISMTESYQSK